MASGGVRPRESRVSSGLPVMGFDGFSFCSGAFRLGPRNQRALAVVHQIGLAVNETNGIA